MFRLGLFVLILVLGNQLTAQEVNEDIPTNNTVHKRVNQRKNEPKRKVYDRIYRKNTKGTMYGNPCAIEVTHRMGFEYVPLSHGHGKSPIGVILNNVFVGTRLVFTRSPFWKMILKKRLKDCRTSSGDGIG